MTPGISAPASATAAPAGLPGLHLVGATAFRDAITGWTRDAGIPPAEAARLADLIGAGNATRLYGQAT